MATLWEPTGNLVGDKEERRSNLCDIFQGRGLYGWGDFCIFASDGIVMNDVLKVMAMRIYTRSGDGGRTGIHGGGRVEKDDVRIEANGALDELNAHIGLLRALLGEGHEWQGMLKRVQEALMVVMSQVATPAELREKNPNVLDEGLDVWCEREIDRLEEETGQPSGCFVLPGGGVAAAQCHVARTVARRAERRLWTLNREDEVPGVVLRFVNRLSDLLFVMARCEVAKGGGEEERWKDFLYKKGM